MSHMQDPVTGETFLYLTRNEWGARQPNGRVPLVNVNAGIFGHHAVTGTYPAATIWRGVQAYHMDTNGWRDIAYSFGVSDDGTIFEGRGMMISGGHTEGYNSTSHAICYIGNSDNYDPPSIVKRAFNCVRRNIEIVSHRSGQSFRPHGSVNQTACPGGYLKAWINGGAHTNEPPGGVMPPTDNVPPPVEPDPNAKVYIWKYYRKPTVLTTNLSRAKRNDAAEVQFCYNLTRGTQQEFIRVDGHYGNITAQAVRIFQEEFRRFWKDSRMIVDGKFGPYSSDAMALSLALKGFVG